MAVSYDDIQLWSSIATTDSTFGLLPISILVHIIHYMSPRERLLHLAHVNRAFNALVYSPSCFQDIWILPSFPTDLEQITTPFLRLTHKSARDCIEVNVALQHAFIAKVVNFLHRWYIPSNELLHRSLQKRSPVQDPYQWLHANRSVLEIDIDFDYNNTLPVSHRSVDILSLNAVDHEETKNMDVVDTADNHEGGIQHLYINGAGSIEYDIVFPSDLRSLHLQCFDSHFFALESCRQQIVSQKKFVFVEYLSFYKCHFEFQQIQYFSVKNCPKLSILELIETTWKGIFYLPSPLKSIRWKATRGKLSFKYINPDSLIECAIPTLSKSILNCLRRFRNLRRLVLFCKNSYTLSQGDHYHFSEVWEEQLDLKIVYCRILEQNDRNLRTNLNIIFPNALLQSVDVIAKNDYSIWEEAQSNPEKYLSLLKAFMQ